MGLNFRCRFPHGVVGLRGVGVGVGVWLGGGVAGVTPAGGPPVTGQWPVMT